ncbi:hypothetical protein A9Q81_27905 [Gammaproteobacteria bacterium 42_54_T18]|nr:hypothetical protein A9Q81_27905 [Gammaproteobacteria bacterium 42_54_T18]
MDGTNTVLDPEELFYLALQASAQGDHAKAIGYLKEGIAIKPSAKLYYILGAEHAGIGMYERAVDEMTKALEIDETLDTARFQLGLLKMTMNDVEGAKVTWSQLDMLDNGEPLKLFKTAILLAVSGDFKQAIEVAQQGVDVNEANIPLNIDMNNLIDRWKGSVSDEGEGAESFSEDTENGNHFFLSAYKDDKNQ